MMQPQRILSDPRRRRLYLVNLFIGWLNHCRNVGLLFILVVLVTTMVLQLNESPEQFLLAENTWRRTTEAGSLPVPLPMRSQEELPITKSYIPTEFLGVLDIFSAAWWQRVDRFRQTPFDNYHGVEDNVFQTVLRVGYGLGDARLTTDWLDFSVEHGSKWWTNLRFDNAPYVIARYQAYAQHQMHEWTRRNQEKEPLLFSSTLAVVPLGITPTLYPPNHQKIWGHALTACLSRLISLGAARVVIVGHFPADERLTRRAFEILQRPCTDSNSSGSDEIHVKATDLVYIHTDNVRTKYIDVNTPYGALHGLTQAINGTLNESSAAKWLGADFFSKIKYIYMTEADQLLHTRLTLVEATPLLDDGRVIIPHRLQPIPHPLDLEGIEKNDSLLPVPEFAKVHEMMYDSSSCCDSHRMAVDEVKNPCPHNYWWNCGFFGYGDHSRLRSYRLMRLNAGLGIVHLAATEHGRKCRPAVRGECNASPN